MGLNKDEIVKGNKLISFYIGGKEVEPQGHTRRNIQFPFQVEYLYTHNENNLLFHKSWEWLMPVIEIIERDNYGFKMCRKVVEVYIDDTKEIIVKEKRGSRIESLWFALIAFINLKNSQS